jgi:hypothetical protein
MKYEKKYRPLAPKSIYIQRVGKNLIFSIIITFLIWTFGAIGYAYFGNCSVTVAYYNAAMIMTGMGPAYDNPCNSLMWFASFYALISGVVYLSSIGVILAPIVHRFIHQFHLEDEE